MKKIVAMVLSVAVLLWGQGCSDSPPASQGDAKIAATIFPLCDIARNIVGDRFEVIEILPPGTSPHTYELTPRQVKRLQGVPVVLSVGHGLDDWTNNLVEALPEVRTVVVDSDVRLKQSGPQEEHGEHPEHAEGTHNHEGANPHYWLSMSNGKIIARNIAKEVIQLDPSNERYYKENLEAFLSRLDEAKTEIEERMRELPGRKMITFHDAWFYFAEEFGLEIVGTFEPFPGKQPTPRYLAELQEKAQKHNVVAVFSEPQLSNEAIGSFVKDIGLKLYVLDPLGGTEGRNSYIGVFNYNAGVIAEALSDEQR